MEGVVQAWLHAGDPRRSEKHRKVYVGNNMRSTGSPLCSFHFKFKMQHVHISIEVHYITPEQQDYTLVPGQVFPVSTLPPDGRSRYRGKLGRVEMMVFTSLWEGEKVYTDVSSSPLDEAYIRKEGLENHSYAHSTKDGFGITTLKFDSALPGMFGRGERSVAPYPISLLLAHERRARYVRGPAVHMHLVPETYLRLRDTATRVPGDVQRYDVFSGTVGNYRRLGLPIVLGAFDTFLGREKPWQHQLLEAYMSPSATRGYELVGFIGGLADPGTGERSGDVEGGPYDKYEYYLSYAEGYLSHDQPYIGVPNPRMTFISPYTKGDAWAHLDVGRRRVSDWKEGIRNISVTCPL